MRPSRQWIAACGLAEAIGMTAAAGAARSADAVRDAGGAVVVALLVVVCGGLVEGAALGLLQGGVLRRHLGGRVGRRWAVATVLGAGLGWAVASAPAAFAGQDSGVQPPLWLVVLGAAALGAAMGVVLGSAQAIALRGAVAGARRWIPVNALAWSAAMVVIFLGATFPTAEWPTLQVVLLGTGTGVLAGVVLGLLTARQVVVLIGGPAGPTTTGESPPPLDHGGMGQR